MYKIVTIKVLNDFSMDITFNDGYKTVIDFKPFINDGVSEPLKDYAYFKQAKIESGGGLEWPNGYDFCPNFLREYAN